MKTVKMFIKYDLEIMTSYEYDHWIQKTFGDLEVKEAYEEVRDHLGYLKGFNIEVRVDEHF